MDKIQRAVLLAALLVAWAFGVSVVAEMLGLLLHVYRDVIVF